MTITLRRNAQGKVVFHPESTEGFPAIGMVRQKLGGDAHIEPADLIGTLRLAGDTVVAVRGGGTAGKAAARQFGVMVALQPPNIVPVPLADALAAPKTVPLDSDTVLTARDIGVCLGD
jgi:ribosomal protein S9